MLSAILVATWMLAAPPELPIEAPLPSDAVRLKDPDNEPGRYRSLRSYEELLDFYRRIFNQTGGVRWHNIVQLPTIKAKNVESLRPTTKWEGINIYEKQGEVRIYVLPRVTRPK